MNVKWHNRFINLALEVSNWSKDHKQVGCVIVDSDTNKDVSADTGVDSHPESELTKGVKTVKG